jgi:hypothetical protein
MTNTLVKNVVLKFMVINEDGQEKLSIDYFVSHNDEPYVQKFSKIEYPKQAVELYGQWQENYEKFKQLGTPNDSIRDNSFNNTTEPYNQNQEALSVQEMKSEVMQNFESCIAEFRKWFSQIQHETISLEKEINNQFSSSEKSKLTIFTDDEKLQKLFWHRLLGIDDKKRYGKKTGLVLALSNSNSPEINHQPNIIKDDLKILVIYGNNAKDEHNAKQELNLWKNWADTINQKYPKDDHPIETMEAPENYDSLIDKFKEKDWEIVYFTGHGSFALHLIDSDRQSINNCPMIGICNKEITTNTFCRTLTQNNPNLKLVILNCCEGLELGKELISNGIHQVICMREVITSETSYLFLKFFLEEFKDEPCLHIALNKTQIRLSVEDGNDLSLGSCSMMALLQNSNTSHLEWHPPDEKSSTNTVHNFISKFSVKTIIIFTTILIVFCAGVGFLLHLLLTEYFKPSRQAKALSYTFDICLVDDKNKNCETGYFLHKEINKNDKETNKNDTPPPKFTYQAVVPPSLIEKIQQGKNVKIYTEKGEENGKIEIKDYSLLKDTPDYLTLSFPSDNDYEFPNFNPKGLFEIFLKKQKNIRLIAENIILVYKIDKASQKDFDHSIGVLTRKVQNTQYTVNDKKFVYFGYILDPELIQFIINNSTNNFEIHTLKDEKFTNKGPITDENKHEMVFEYYPIEDKNIIWFKFLSNKNYDCPEALNNSQDLKNIAQNYELYSKKSKNNQNQERY